jgi:adenylyltransferase/sulfurtransferase
VLGCVPAVIGSIQAAEAIKFLLGTGELLTNRLLVFDVLEMQFRTVKLRRNGKCPLCGERKKYPLNTRKNAKERTDS